MSQAAAIAGRKLSPKRRESEEQTRGNGMRYLRELRGRAGLLRLALGLGGAGLGGALPGVARRQRQQQQEEDQRGGEPHEPYGIWLKSQPVADPAVAARYNCTDLFELKSKRFAEIGQVSMPGNR